MSVSKQPLPRFSLTVMLLAIAGAEARSVVGQGPPTAQVRYTEARWHEVRRSVVLTGSVESRRTSVVASEVEGVVETLLAREGDRVDRGAPLVRLRRTNLELRLEAVRGQLTEAQARQNLASTSLDRARGLFEEKIVSQQQLDDAVSESEAWQGRVRQLRAEVARLEHDLARATVRAPFRGVLVEELAAEGEWLGEGGAVAELLDFRDLEVTVQAPEGAYAGLIVGSSAQVVIPSLGDYAVEGQVRAVVPRADSRARTFPVKIALADPQDLIAVGMLAEVYLPVGELREALIVPKDAVVEQGGEAVVFRIGTDGAAQRVSVRLGSPVGSWLVVEGLLEVGDRVVTRGNERLFAGQAVEAEPLEYELP